MLSIQRLRTFVEVARQGSFSKAARSLFLTQPSVSRQVASLERELKTPLIRRTPRGLVLTDAGRLLVDRSDAIIAELSALERELSSLCGAEAPPLRLGSFASANVLLVPEALRAFLCACPDSRVAVVSSSPERHLEALVSGEVDAAIVADWDVGHCDEWPELELAPLIEDELLLALPAAHACAHRRRIRLRDFSETSWIEGAHPDCLGPIETVFQELGAEPRIEYFCDEWVGKQAMIAAGLGVALLPALGLTGTLEGIVLRSLDGDVPRRRLYVAWRADESDESPAWTLAETLQATAHRQRPYCATASP
jgi:DNA-binding transcriptional LysR family regulator